MGPAQTIKNTRVWYKVKVKSAIHPKIDAKFKFSPYRKETFKLLKNSFDDPVKDPIRFLCRTI